MLLSFALLVALASASTQAFAGPGGHRHDIQPLTGTTQSTAGTSSVAFVTTIASITPATAPAVITVAHNPYLGVPPLPPVARPKRTTAATTQDDVGIAGALAALAAAPPVSTRLVATVLADDGAATAFIAHASRSSRTRGQPVSDC